jgi:hypothetical protein
MSHKSDDPSHLLIALALVVALLLLTTAYHSNRYGGVDEIGLFNPTYMDYTYGRITYPAHSYFDVMVVHPPVHYKVIAALMRCGLPLYYAQATPVVASLLLALWLVVRSRMSWPLRAGFLFALWLPYAFFLNFGLELFGMRPEGALGAAWMAGLAALESARSDGWRRGRLFLGSLLVTYAGVLHYYAPAAALAAPVYAVAAIRDLGWRAARGSLLALAAGCAIVGVPLVALWAWPYRNEIYQMLRSTRRPVTIADTFAAHLREYAYVSGTHLRFPGLRQALASGIPLAAMSSTLLIALRETRVLALAALPIQLFVLLAAWHKHGYYLFHEIAMLGLAVVTAMSVAAAHAAGRLPSGAWRRLAASAVVAALIAMLWNGTHWIRGARWSATPRIHEQETARAAGREILGPTARVASRISIWYGAGAADWHDPTYALLHGSPTLEQAWRYMARFNAVGESQHMSDATGNSDGTGILSWYVSGAVKARGFFFAEANTSLSYLLLHVAPPAFAGFGKRPEGLYRFDPNAAGDWEFVTLAGPDTPALTEFRRNSLMHNVMPVPPAAGPGVLTMAVVRPGAEIPAGHRLVERVRVSRKAVDEQALVARLRREDRPIRFHRMGEW